MAADPMVIAKGWLGRARPGKRQLRAMLLFAGDLLLSLLALRAAIPLSYGAMAPAMQGQFIWNWSALFLLQFLSLSLFRLYDIQLRFVGILELGRLFGAFFVSTTLAMVLGLFFFRQALGLSVPVSVLLIQGLLAFSLFGALRLVRRVFLEFIPRVRPRGKPTLIVGANAKTERLIKELRNSDSRLEPVLVADVEDDGLGGKIYGLPVVDCGEAFARHIHRRSIDTALINLPAAGRHQVRHVFDCLRRAGVADIRIVPRINEWQTSVQAIRQIDIGDLLAREPVRIEFDAVAARFADRRVLVTGAAGSIGSEIVRKLHALGATWVVALDSDESGTFQLQQELRPRLGKDDRFAFVVGSLRDPEKLRAVFAQYRPQIVFHAAAYKHVPLMEEFPEEALRTNVLGTCDLALLAIEQHVERFINISTDKVVKPRSVMGASKRLAEMACQGLNGNGTRFLSVRFGNVLGSRGSVVPLFQEQIRRGGPITLTHPDMQRYFMSIPEAVLLVFQAAHLGKGGDVLVLDMGEPVRIRDLAESLIRLHGLEPGSDIEIVITGPRPGEKLFEEILTAEEGVDATSHDKIFVARFSDRMPPGFVERLTADCRAAGRDPERIHALFATYIPSYRDD